MLPDVRGLYRFYEELALRFAERGSAAIAIDYFGRTAEWAKRDDDFPYMEHVAQTEPEGDPGRCCAPPSRGCARRGRLGERIFTVGFCFGGRIRGSPRRGITGSRARSASTARSASATGSPVRSSWPRRCRRPSSRSRPATTPTSPPRTTRPSIARSTAAGVEHEVVTYEGAPHSFFDRKQAEHQAASDDAWARVERFIDAH